MARRQQRPSPLSTSEQEGNTTVRMKTIAVATVIAAGASSADAQTECARLLGTLQVREEPRRSGYERPGRGAYRGLEPAIYAGLGMDRTPYTCTEIGGRGGLRGRDGTDIEHVVALAETFDSGLPAGRLEAFSGDLTNLTLATPQENRYRKGDRDAADYAPPFNACWWACQSVRVKARWRLGVDGRERAALQRILWGCTAESSAAPACPAR